ncbi:hydrogenase nickel incorporation protein HypB [Romboutsia sp.]|uniref:hydrogenase nickel incorporation protein HypB n=1 Tax=Romboutsia sp. TaxID=1965302 RepID=UPI002D073442|nr:hydrogenase nickel incorporation protein HypB [Romboutsia sp.]HSQ87793.1 hydrogenase nickel incorporation protein HypB [Romboutsia sp.]
MKQILVKKDILKNNNSIADENRILLNEKKIFTMNLLGSPGAGKTSVLEQIIENMKDDVNMSVIEGDLYTTKDAQRIENKGIDVIQVNTGGACHLDAAMIKEAMDSIDIDNLDFLVIENVGNLVCPASYDLSEDIKVTVMSITEGNDKPLKYPSMFQRSQVIILNKIDILEFTNFNMDEFYNDIRSLNKEAKVFEVSCRTKEGVTQLCDYLRNLINLKRGN